MCIDLYDRKIKEEHRIILYLNPKFQFSIMLNLNIYINDFNKKQIIERSRKKKIINNYFIDFDSKERLRYRFSRGGIYLDDNQIYEKYLKLLKINHTFIK